MVYGDYDYVIINTNHLLLICSFHLPSSIRMSLGRFSVFLSTGVAISGFAMTRMWKRQRDLNCCSCLEQQGQGIHQSNTADVPDIRFKMLSSQVFMRHGARTPLFHIPGVKEVSRKSLH